MIYMFKAMLLVDAFETLQNTCREISDLEPVHFLTINCYRYVIKDRKKYWRRNMACYSPICES